MEGVLFWGMGHKENKGRARGEAMGDVKPHRDGGRTRVAP